MSPPVFSALTCRKRNCVQLRSYSILAAVHSRIAMQLPQLMRNSFLSDLGPGRHAQIHPGVPLSLPEHHFYIALSVQVLEHVWDLDDYFSHFQRQLESNGRLILSTHGVWIYHPHPGDFRRWTRVGLCRELESRGFIVENITPVLGPLAWSTQIRSLGISLVLFRLGAVGALLSVAVSLMMNLRMRVEDLATPTAIAMDNACVYVVTARPTATTRQT